MNRDHVKKNEGHLVRLQPPAQGPRGEAADDDWVILSVTDDVVRLAHTRSNAVASLGLDHVFSFFSDPARSTDGQRYGFLQLHSQLRIDSQGRVAVEPLPPPRARRAAQRAVPNPLVVRVGDQDHYFSWRGRGNDAVHLIDGEEEPHQLYEAHTVICAALRRDSGREPQFDLPTDLRGEVVYELSPDGQARWKLLGGAGGKAGQTVLVVTNRKAREVESRVETSAPPEVEWVDTNYPTRSGVQQRLEGEGFSVRWGREDQLAQRIDKGWEVVVVEANGRKTIPKVAAAVPDVDPSPLVLIRRPAARQPLDQRLPLRVTLQLIRNIGAGATPGVWIRGINEEAETVRGAAFKLLDVLRWNESVSRFVETQDIHQNGPFQELETGKNHLFCSQSADLGFVRAEDNSLRIEGGRDGHRDQCRISTTGVWKLIGEIVAADGRRCDVAACFHWEGSGSPMPVVCPPHSLVTETPAPHRPVGG